MQQQDILLFGETYEEISEDGTKRRIDPRELTLKHDKTGKLISYDIDE